MTTVTIKIAAEWSMTLLAREGGNNKRVADFKNLLEKYEEEYSKY